MNAVLVIAAIWTHLRCVVDAEKPKYFNVGLIFPIATPEWTVSPGVKFFAAMDMAFDEINNKHDGVYDDILPLTELRMVTRNPPQTFGRGALAASAMLGVDNGKGVMACVGPASQASLKGTRQSSVT